MSKSSAKAKYRVMASTTSKLTCLLGLLKDLQIPHVQPTLLFCDNKTAFHIRTNPIFYKTTKHIEIDCHIVKEKLQSNIIKTLHVSSQHQLSDIFTKALVASQFHNLLSKMGVINIYTPS